MSTLKAILVDDEESSRDVLGNLLARFCPDVELKAKCKNLLEAVEEIKKHTPDIVFLDIEMPNYAGYEIVNFFDDITFEIVFVTAYDNYAIKAFEIAALDYLLKPIVIERLKASVNRVKEKKLSTSPSQQLNLLNETIQNKELKNILLTDKGQQYIVAIDNIIAIEAQESYCIIYTTEKRFIASKNLKHFETLLETIPNFIRSHKSWLINKSYILHYSKSDLTIQLKGNLTAKLSKYKKVEFEAAIA